jgi:hypothetical protein
MSSGESMLRLLAEGCTTPPSPNVSASARRPARATSAKCWRSCTTGPRRLLRAMIGPSSGSRPRNASTPWVTCVTPPPNVASGCSNAANRSNRRSRTSCHGARPVTRAPASESEPLPPRVGRHLACRRGRSVVFPTAESALMRPGSPNALSNMYPAGPGKEQPRVAIAIATPR